MRVNHVTLPSIRITDQAFQYRKSQDTNLAETFARARERLETPADPQAAAQTPAKPVRRVRAGHPTLPLFPMEGAPC